MSLFCSDDADAAGNIIRDGFEPALDASREHLQNLIEGHCHDLTKEEGKRDAHAGGIMLIPLIWLASCSYQSSRQREQGWK